MNPAAELLAHELERVLEGTVRLEHVLADPLQAQMPLAACLHGLQHFLADEDIRAKDSAYRQMQEGEMRKLIGLIRAGADESVLRRVTFLGAGRAQAF